MSRLCVGWWILICLGRKLQFLTVLSLSLCLPALFKVAYAAPSAVWEAGRLDYVNGGAEVAAFVNQEQVQLQVVLCALNTASAYRLTLLLSHSPKSTGLIPVKLLVDGSTTNAYAEVSGNSVEFQVGIQLLISLTYSPSLEIVFSKSDAANLKLPETLQISMAQADLALNEVARSCTLLCRNQDFSCNQPLLSGILWPRNGFDQEGDRSDPSVGTYRQLLGVPNTDDESFAPKTAKSRNLEANKNKEGTSNDFSADPTFSTQDAANALGHIDTELGEVNADLDMGIEGSDWTEQGWSDDTLPEDATSDVGNFEDVSDFEYVQANDTQKAGEQAADSGKGSAAGSTAGGAGAVKPSVSDTSVSEIGTSDSAAADASADPEVDLSQDALNHNCLQWPRTMSGYERSVSDMYALTPSFKLNKKCKKLLDMRFERDGKWALSFMPTIFKDPDSDYQTYQKHWNILVKAVDPQGKLPDTLLRDDDYYLALFTLFTTTNLHEFPQSYFDLLNFDDDPATFIYAMDNRYDLETIKYYAVLERRLKGSVSLLRTASHTYQVWEKFYQDFAAALPPIPKAQALRPVLYRQMLMRVWRLAGYPDPLHLRPQFAFTQGTYHRTITREPLEAKCSVFEGSKGDQFFFASPECVRGIYSDLGRMGYLNDDFKQVQLHWDAFAKATNQSQLLSLSTGDAVGSNDRAGLALALLSMYKIYGFGDYFLLRNCLSTRDSDICAFQTFKSQQDYFSEVRNSISSISVTSEQDAKMLSQLNELWRRYYDSLKSYTEGLVRRGKLKPWRAHFVQGVAVTTQTETLLSGSYYRQTIDPED